MIYFFQNGDLTLRDLQSGYYVPYYVTKLQRKIFIAFSNSVLERYFSTPSGTCPVFIAKTEVRLCACPSGICTYQTLHTAKSHHGPVTRASEASRSKPIVKRAKQRTVHFELPQFGAANHSRTPAKGWLLNAVLV